MAFSPWHLFVPTALSSLITYLYIFCLCGGMIVKTQRTEQSPYGFWFLKVYTLRELSPESIVMM